MTPQARRRAMVSPRAPLSWATRVQRAVTRPATDQEGLTELPEDSGPQAAPIPEARRQGRVARHVGNVVPPRHSARWGLATLALIAGCAAQVDEPSCNAPTFTGPDCWDPGGGVTRCAANDGSYWDKQPTGHVIHWRQDSAPPAYTVLCEED